MIGLSVGEQRVEVAVGQAVRMLPVRLEPHQVDDVDHANLQVGELLAQKLDRGQRLERRARRRRRP